MRNAAYNPAGALASATLGLDGANQWTETRGYNSRLQARRVEVTKGASTLLRPRWAYSGAYNSTTLEETGTDNPLALVDPDGQEEVRVTIRAFIPEQSFRYPGGIGPVWRGDGRSFSTASNASGRVFQLSELSPIRGSVPIH